MFTRTLVKISVLSLCLTICNAMAAAQSATPDILYVQQNTSILTYVVNPATLETTLVGQPLVLDAMVYSIHVVPSPKGRFLYILSAKSGYDPASVSVYRTDESGVPQSPPVQVLPPRLITQFAIAPNGKFAYANEYKAGTNNDFIYSIRLYSVDAVTGKLNLFPKPQAVYAPSQTCWLEFWGFARPSVFGDAWFCGGGGTPSDDHTYYYRDMNTQTGLLGPDQEIFKWTGTSINSDEVLFGRRAFDDLNISNANGTSFSIYSLSATPQLLIHCTTSMLPACGQANSYVRDHRGEYVILSVYPTQIIAKVDWTTHRITDTGSSLTTSPAFSLDDRIIYGLDIHADGSANIQVYGFDTNTAALTAGPSIIVPQYQNLWVASRQ